MSGILLLGGRWLAAPIHPEGSSEHYVHWGMLPLSVANLVIIGLLLLVAVAAVVLPFPRRRGRR